MGVEEALRALIELVDVSFSRGKEGILYMTPSTLNRWKKVHLRFFLSTSTRSTTWGAEA
jgi:hypothetical protein